jgi:hypothetical protein
MRRVLDDREPLAYELQLARVAALEEYKSSISRLDLVPIGAEAADIARSFGVRAYGFDQSPAEQRVESSHRLQRASLMLE